MDFIPYDEENLKEIRKRTEYEISKILQFLQKIENIAKNAHDSLRLLYNIYNNNLEKVEEKKSEISKKIKNEEILKNKEKVEKLHQMIFPHISSMEKNRLQSDKGILIACETYHNLRKKGYEDNMIHQAVFNATKDLFWSRQFRSLAKLTRKNRDDVYYIDVFLAIGQKNHKVSIPKIVR